MAVLDIKAVIFDCFGVLYVDTNTSILSHVPLAKQREAHDIFTANNYGQYTKVQYIEEIAHLTGMTAAEVESYIRHEHHLNTPLIKFIEEDVKTRYKVGLLSNIGRGWITDLFDKHQLHDLFDEVVLSGEEGMTKPDPAIYELMAARLGVEPTECVMIDDIEANCEGAVLAGMSALHFTSNDQLLTDLYHLGVLHKSA